MDEEEVRAFLSARYDMGYNFVLEVLFIKESDTLTTQEEVELYILISNASLDADHS